ncbi:Eukaryotic peptide chain release factor subunit 1-3 [Linum perenne]
MSYLEPARGNGLLSLFISPSDQISRVAEDLSARSRRISDRNIYVDVTMNRDCLQESIAFFQDQLKTYDKIPPNGLVLYAGTVFDEDEIEKLTVVFEPFRPIGRTLCDCHVAFNIKPLHQLVESDETFGFIIMGRQNTLFGIVRGSTRETIDCASFVMPAFYEEQPDFENRCVGYIDEINRRAKNLFIDRCTYMPIVSGIILAGMPGYKEVLGVAKFKGKIADLIIFECMVAKDDESGFSSAIWQSTKLLSGVKFIQLANKICKILWDRSVRGLDVTIMALDEGSVETLIVWEDSEVNRYELKNSANGEIVVKYLNKKQEMDKDNFWDSATSAKLEVLDKMSLVEWFVNVYKTYNCTLELITNQGSEHKKFCSEFDGIGGILREDPSSTDEKEDHSKSKKNKKPF